MDTCNDKAPGKFTCRGLLCFNCDRQLESHRGPGFCLSQGCQHRVGIWQGIALFLGHDLPSHRDREFAMIAVDHLHLDPRLLFQGCRQTGGVSTETASDGTLPNHYFLHRKHSFLNGGRTGY